mgnify:CR=1 FL=1
MKVILLAGGLGTRLGEFTNVIPKPMVPVGGKPILWHIMQRYARFDHNDFYVALGYKAEIIKEYFLNYRSFNTDFSISLNKGSIKHHHDSTVDWNVTLVNTGEKSLTGGRVKRMRDFVGNETCMMTYGDGLADIDIDALLDFHRSHGKMITVSAVRPPSRFGEMQIDGNIVSSFKEKPQLHEGWINGGYFIFEEQFFDLIEGDKTSLEKEPLEKAASLGELMAFKHEGFWQCMDTKRDHELLEKLWLEGAPWIS